MPLSASGFFLGLSQALPFASCPAVIAANRRIKNSTSTQEAQMKSVIVAGFFVGMLIQPCQADPLDNMKKMFDIIGDFADRTCSERPKLPISPPMQGGTTSREYEVHAKAEVSWLIRQLVDLGIEGIKRERQSDYYGLPQEDLVIALRDAHAALRDANNQLAGVNECRRRVAQDFNYILEQAIPSATSAGANNHGASAKSVYGNKRCEAQAGENGASSSCDTGAGEPF
jgi:hypothetical protein